MRVIWKDRHLLVVDKPSGQPAQPDPSGRPSVLEEAQSRFARVFLHHRLDTPASGLMVLALDEAANPGLARAFREHLAQRVYLAVVLGDPGPAGRWDQPLEGRPAATRFERLRGGARSVLRVELETGRTHQVRLHAAGAGHPLLGDRRHGGAAGALWPRLALHAWRLRLPHPVTGEWLEFEAPIPDDLRDLVGAVG